MRLTEAFIADTLITTSKFQAMICGEFVKPPRVAQKQFVWSALCTADLLAQRLEGNSAANHLDRNVHGELVGHDQQH